MRIMLSTRSGSPPEPMSPLLTLAEGQARTRSTETEEEEPACTRPDGKTRPRCLKTERGRGPCPSSVPHHAPDSFQQTDLASITGVQIFSSEWFSFCLKCFLGHENSCHVLCQSARSVPTVRGLTTCARSSHFSTRGVLGFE